MAKHAYSLRSVLHITKQLLGQIAEELGVHRGGGPRHVQGVALRHLRQQDLVVQEESEALRGGFTLAHTETNIGGNVFTLSC